MKLASVKYNNSEHWYTPEYLPDNPRDILIYTKEFGTTSGYYLIDENKWYSFRWSCFIEPVFWREMPRYESKDNI